MPVTIRPILVTPDLDRMVAFHSALLGAVEVMRFPEDGPPFYVGLEVGNAELGISVAAEVQTGSPGRTLLSIDVPDVDELLPRVRARWAAAPRRRPTTCRRVRASPT